MNFNISKPNNNKYLPPTRAIKPTRRKAFTLAEVLTTLMVIGVVAALTIPNLMQSYKKTEVETKLKEAYSILSDVVQRVTIETEMSFTELVDQEVNNSSQNEATQFIANTYIKPYLKIAKQCDASNKADSSECSIFEDIRITSLGGNFVNVDLIATPRMYEIQLVNGMLLATKIATMSNKNSFNFIVDINEVKGPNRLGYDTFYFTVQENSNRLNSTAYRDAPQDGRTWCTEEYWFGANCGQDILRNGWKIPNNYPVKFK